MERDDLYPYPRCEHGCVAGECWNPGCMFAAEDAERANQELAATVPERQVVIVPKAE